MWLKHSKYWTDLIFACFYRMPFQDRLRTPIVQVLVGFGIHFTTLWILFWGSGGNSFGNVCAIGLLLDFCLISGAGGWSQAEGPAAEDVVPGHAFSDIWI